MIALAVAAVAVVAVVVTSDRTAAMVVFHLILAFAEPPIVGKTTPQVEVLVGDDEGGGDDDKAGDATRQYQLERVPWIVLVLFEKGDLKTEFRAVAVVAAVVVAAACGKSIYDDAAFGLALGIHSVPVKQRYHLPKSLRRAQVATRMSLKAYHGPYF